MDKLDRRVRRTRRILASALIELSLEVGFDQVSVRQLADRADVGYATFFRHYKTTDQLLTEIMLGIVHQIAADLRPEMTHYEESLVIYQAVEANRDAFIIGINLPQDHPAMRPVWDEVSDLVLEIHTARYDFKIPAEVLVNHIVKSVVELLRWWLTEGQQFSPVHMAAVQSELLFKGLESATLASVASS